MPLQSPTLSPTLSAITAEVAWVVFRDPRLDLADEIRADVRGLGEDTASQTGEDGDQRTAEREPDEVIDRRVGGVVEDAGEDE